MVKSQSFLDKNITRRKLLSGMATTAIGASLVGCGGGETPTPTPTAKVIPTPALASGNNLIAIENQKSGTSSWQLTKRALHREIEGYASSVSVNRGEQIVLFVNTAETEFSVEFFRLGWYGGLGGRSMGSAIRLLGTKQIIPLPDVNTGMVQCAWSPSYSFTIPNNADATDWASGVYVAKLTALNSGAQSYITFVVRDDTRPSDLLFQVSVNTYQAYNAWGGTSLYSNENVLSKSSGVYTAAQAVKVSFDRPYINDRFNAGAGELFSYEYNMIRWIERAGYDVSYNTDLDTHLDAGGLALLRHKGFLIVGHDEYWTLEMLNNVESARDGGTGIGYFGGNACYWQVRYEPDSSGNANRVMVCYKQFAFKNDPYASSSDPSQRQRTTTCFIDAAVNRREDALLGLIYNDIVPISNTYDIIVENTSNPVFANTGLKDGDKISGLLLGEVDELAHSSCPIKGVIRLGHSPFTLASGKSSFGDMSIYQTSNGAYVFSAGTLGWTRGLDSYMYFSGVGAQIVPQSIAAQQITSNVLALFGAKPS